MLQRTANSYSFQLRNKTCSPCLHNLVKTKAKGFHLFENSHKLCREKAMEALPSYGGTEDMFYVFYKIIPLRLNREKDYIRNAYVYLNFFHETAISYNLETQPTILLVIFMLHSAMKTHLKTNQNRHVLSKLFYKNIYASRWLKGR